MRRYEVKRTDYKWSPCWGLFDHKTRCWITKDITRKLIMQHVHDANIDLKETL